MVIHFLFEKQKYITLKFQNAQPIITFFFFTFFLLILLLLFFRFIVESCDTKRQFFSNFSNQPKSREELIFIFFFIPLLSKKFLFFQTFSFVSFSKRTKKKGVVKKFSASFFRTSYVNFWERTFFGPLFLHIKLKINQIVISNSSFLNTLGETHCIVISFFKLCQNVLFVCVVLLSDVFSYETTSK